MAQLARVHTYWLFCLTAGLVGASVVLPAAAATDDWHEIETRHIFGFTSGSGVGHLGEKEAVFDTIGRLGKASGHYIASETKFGIETTPTQRIQVEFGALAATHSIAAVGGLVDRQQIAFSGIYGEIRYLLFDRTQVSPLSVTLSAEPVWRRISQGTGEIESNFEFEAKINADIELVRHRFFAAFNVLYGTEVTRAANGVFRQESKFGLSGAMVFRLRPNIAIGGEAWYLRHYHSLGFDSFDGDAFLAGPTFYINLTPKVFLLAAWNAQLWGREVVGGAAQPSKLNLAEFERHRARVMLGVEF